jgi:DNA-binding winged helix-turn-helix (wHTH) protein/Tol biopolymer transport system component
VNDPQPLLYEFDDFRIDTGRRLLTQRGAPVPIKPKVFDTLLYLARNQGRLVEKDELLRSIWPDTVVEENSLNQCVSTLRRTLGESPGENRYIVTVPGRGYRFAPITRAINKGASNPEAPPHDAVRAPTVAVTAEGVGRRTIPQPSPGRSPWMLAGVLAAVLAVFIGVARRGSITDSSRRVIWLDLDVGNEVSQPAIAPDGRSLVFVASGRLMVRRLDQANITPLKSTDGASSPFFSPDGRWIGYFANHELRKVALEGGESVILCAAARDRGGSWTEDGRIIAALSASGELSSIPASGGVPRPFSQIKTESPGVTSHSRPHVLPGGKGVVFVAGAGVATGSLRVVPLSGGPAKTLVENSSIGRYIGGYLIFNRGVKIFSAPMDLNRLEVTGMVSPFIDGVAYDHFRGADFDVSASGTLIYRRTSPTSNRAVMWLDRFGLKGRVFPKAGPYTSPRLSPDGKRLALTSESELWIYELAREKMTQLTFGSEVECCPVWSPDGEYVVFRSHSGIAWTRWDGSGIVQRAPAGYGPRGTPWSFSPLGKWLAFFGSSPLTGFDLWAAPVDRVAGVLQLGQPLPLLTQPGLQAAPAISPDGRWLTYASDHETGRTEVYVIPLSLQDPSLHGKWPVSTDGGRAPRWSVDGGEIFFRSVDDHLMAASVTRTRDSVRLEKARVWHENRLADLGGPPNFDVAPDGKHIVAMFDAEETKPDQTHLRVLLNLNNELRRLRATRSKEEPQ